jgi:hypothetical protein
MMSDLTHEKMADSIREWMQSTVDFRREFHASRPEQSKLHNELKYLCPEEYIVKHGRAYLPSAFTDDELRIILAAAKKRNYDFPIKECFSNSQLLVLADESGLINYVEGYANGVIPLHHGWAVFNGKVIDLTMRVFEQGEYVKPAAPFEDRVLGDFPLKRAYFGVEFEHRTVVMLAAARGWVGSILDDWEHDWPILKTGSPFPEKKKAKRKKR